MMKELV